MDVGGPPRPGTGTMADLSLMHIWCLGRARRAKDKTKLANAHGLALAESQNKHLQAGIEREWSRINSDALPRSISLAMR